MKTNSIKIKFGQRSSHYKIEVGRGFLDTVGKWARKCLGDDAVRLVVVSDTTVLEYYGKRTIESLARVGFQVSHFVIKPGESSKTLVSGEKLLQFLSENKISRTDAVVALGGGVVGDLAGFAAAVHLRGIKFLQIPTTLLAMVDSSVGGKTGVNSAAGKNLIGAFHQPSGVLVDVDVLKTLPQRELTAGFCEMIKHGAIGGRKLLERTDAFLTHCAITSSRSDNGNLKFEISDLKEISDLIFRNIEFKAKIVAGDEREAAGNISPRSRKILNFGHTLAHALEKVTNYKLLRHGEAVGYGILFAAELSKSLALFDEKDVRLLNDVVHRAGPLPSLRNIDSQKVLEAFSFDKKHLSGSLQMVLLKGLGKPVIYSQADIPLTTIKKALKTLLR